MYNIFDKNLQHFLENFLTFFTRIFDILRGIYNIFKDSYFQKNFRLLTIDCILGKNSKHFFWNLLHFLEEFVIIFRKNTLRNSYIFKKT